MKKQIYKSNSIVKINLQNGMFTYARLLNFPFVEFYDVKIPEGENPLINEIVDKPVIFVLAVSRHAITQGIWEIIGTTSKPLSPNPAQFMQDIHNPQRCKIIDASGMPRSATVAECKGLERAAVWDPEHVIERINDHYSGKPNRWVESMKLKED